MKVTSIREPLQTIQEVGPKRDQEQRHSKQERDQSRQGRPDDSAVTVSPEEVQRLITEFTRQMSDHGFATRVAGDPPVVSVLDASGRELRQVRLAELVQQSEMLSPPGLTRGRLLDRKV